ncbi:hypothetical protein [Chryseosolibacter indicus]|uniref:Uncharacterized protein n=1 Tax=Chryseosolibacter indicus TaxID=2782351 RepID=A0ABS5VSA4_9BACT|nr:hypothetical protein [Chryseosolibacter indicus]MBT1703654.1 hypothetical protein [Chryseosolibacter indicus]
MAKIFTLFLLVMLLNVPVFAQIDEIKSASRSNSNLDGISGSGSGLVVDLFFNFMLSGMIETQQQKLAQKEDNPSIVSLDVILQTAVHPTDYYIVNPRVRANWGLFSTDFRLNYLIRDDIDGVQYLRTNDWQILQLNLITKKDVTLRVGGGFMQEAFNDHSAFTEWTVGVQAFPVNSKMGGAFEYRDAEPRKEVSAQALFKLFDFRALHGYFSAGAVYQRYYRSISTWGLQGGLICRLY